MCLDKYFEIKNFTAWDNKTAELAKISSLKIIRLCGIYNKNNNYSNMCAHETDQTAQCCPSHRTNHRSLNTISQQQLCSLYIAWGKVIVCGRHGAKYSLKDLSTVQVLRENFMIT